MYFVYEHESSTRYYCTYICFTFFVCLHTWTSTSYTSMKLVLLMLYFFFLLRSHPSQGVEVQRNFFFFLSAPSMSSRSVHDPRRDSEGVQTRNPTSISTKPAFLRASPRKVPEKKSWYARKFLNLTDSSTLVARSKERLGPKRGPPMPCTWRLDSML